MALRQLLPTLLLRRTLLPKRSNVSLCKYAYRHYNVDVEQTGRKATRHEEYVAAMTRYLRGSGFHKGTIYSRSDVASNKDASFQTLEKSLQLLNNVRFSRTTFTVDRFVTLFRNVASIPELRPNKAAVLKFALEHSDKFEEKLVLESLKLVIDYPRMDDGEFLDLMDDKCVRYHGNWNVPKRLLVLDMWFNILREDVQATKYFQCILKEWENDLPPASAHSLIQMLFYVSFQKRAPASLLRSIELRLSGTDVNLSSEDMQIICQCFLRNGVTLTSQVLLEKFVREIEKLLARDISCTFALISFCKVVCRAQHPVSKVARLLKERLDKRLVETFSLIQCAYLMTVLALGGVYDKTLYRMLESHVKRIVEDKNNILEAASNPKKNLKTPPSIELRPKDLARVLWVFSEVGHSYEREFLEQAVRNIRLSFGRWISDYGVLLDAVVSLAVMGHFVPDLINIVLSEKVVKAVSDGKKAKTVKQFIMLDQSVALETDDCTGRRLSPTMVERGMRQFRTDDLKNRPCLQNAAKLFGMLCGDRIKYECVQHIPYIPITGIIFTDTAGILGEVYPELRNRKGSKVAIEVLDSSVCLDGTYHERGFMKMKCRQLAKRGYEIVKIPDHELEDTNEMDENSLSKFSFVLKKNLARCS